MAANDVGLSYNTDELHVDIIRWEKIERDANGDNKNNVHCLFTARETSRRRHAFLAEYQLNSESRILFRSTLYALV